jgi:hypothetical protein
MLSLSASRRAARPPAGEPVQWLADVLSEALSAPLGER